MGFTFETETLNGSFLTSHDHRRHGSAYRVTGLQPDQPGTDRAQRALRLPGAGDSCVADQGDLNYDRGDMFTNSPQGHLRALLKMPEDITFMARGTWIRDFASPPMPPARCRSTPRSVGSNGLSVTTPSRRPRVPRPAPAGPVGEQRLRRGRAGGSATPPGTR
ncbi:DUF1302 family protein [Pseudomonas aeruginosa]